MRADHALTDRQAEARALAATITPGSGVEHVENLRPLLFGNPRPFVADREENLLVIRACAQLQATVSG
ncbi:hypothetical protein D3C74_469120 [compost metagenome]